MLIWRVGFVAALSLLVAACSQQAPQPDADSSVNNRSYVQRNNTHQPPSRREAERDYTPPPRQQGENAQSSAPTQLTPSGDKTYRGQASMGRLPDHIAGKLRALGLNESNMGAYVRAANGGTPLLASYADTPRNPASTMKLVTSYSALGVLGPTYRWPTELYTIGPVANGVLQGDVAIKGYGNPDFSEGDFRQMLQALRARGVRDITGNFIIDKSYFNVGYSPAIDGNTGAAYNAEPEALLYNERGSCYEMRGKAGQVQRVCPRPPRSAADLNANLFGDFWRIWVGEMGGNLQGNLQVRPVPQGAQLAYTHHSTELRNVIAEINKDSNNVMARQVLLSIGAKQFGAPGTTQKGAAAVGQFLESRGLRFSNLKIENGSGLSRMERISAREMGEMLVDAYNSPYRNDLMQSMAVLGVDGTVKNRLRSLAGRGQFKTGTLRDVRALAGYINAANGQPYVVTILHNDPSINGAAKAAHDDLVEWVYSGGR